MLIQAPADLARLVKTRRQARGLTQQHVADAAGITRQSLARIEHGHGGVAFDTVLRILDELGIDLDAKSTDEQPATDVRSTNPHQNHADVWSAVAEVTSPKVDLTSALSSWSTFYSNRIAHLQETAARAGTHISADAARRALLNAAIEEGNPDRERGPGPEGEPAATAQEV